MAAALPSMAGCSSAPSQNILGSYFPSWMLCALAGLVFAIAVRVTLGAVELDDAVPAPLLVYLSAATAFVVGPNSFTRCACYWVSRRPGFFPA